MANSINLDQAAPPGAGFPGFMLFGQLYLVPFFIGLQEGFYVYSF